MADFHLLAKSFTSGSTSATDIGLSELELGSSANEKFVNELLKWLMKLDVIVGMIR